MITVIKLDHQGKEKIRYQGEILEQRPDALVIEAFWSQPDKDLGYTHFVTGDRFVEYYYTNHWFNIFAIFSSDGERKGWYCNIAEPARIYADRIEQIDLLLDVWVNPQGEHLLLDEDEFAAATTLTDEQRAAAQHALQLLLQMVTSQQAPFV